jgi:3-hydroxyisobutyrate dehydrogenase-like beta-hydroxyacid dehydrogenase
MVHIVKSIGLIGIGLVGTALAERFLSSGFQVIGNDVVKAKIEHLERMGGLGASSPTAVARQADIIVLSLMTTDIVIDVINGKNGILSSGNAPSLIIDTTTGDPDKTENLARDLQERGIQYVDAPVAGSSIQIGNGDGVFMVGGSIDAFRMAKEVLDVVSSQVLHVGASGAGSRAKLAVNLVLGLNRLVLAEGLVFAEKIGIDPAKALELFAATPAYSSVMDTKGEKMIHGDFTPEARLSQHLKDVNEILSMASKVNQRLPLSEIHRDLLERSVAAGDGDLDNSAVIKILHQLNGTS